MSGPRLFPAIYTLILGIIAAFLSFILAILIASGDPAEFTLEASNRGIRVAYFIATGGLVFLVICLISSCAWIANWRCPRNILLMVAIIVVLSLRDESINPKMNAETA